MGSVTRRSLAAVLVAVPAVASTVWVSGTSVALPSQAGEAKVGTTADFKFDPAEITVAAGGKVTWTNTGGGYHTVTGGDRAKDPASPMQGVIAAEGDTYSATFANPGTYKYYCEPHLAMGMVGTVTVTAAGGAPATATATAAPTAAASSAAPASASASASVGAPQAGAGAPTNDPDTHAGEEGGHEEAPGVEGNKTLEAIEAERATMKGAVSGFRFFAAVATAFLFILGAAVLFSTRPRRAGK